MDTALRTPKSGYLYRRLANALQDIRIEYDQTVREGSGKIIQFRYGDDGKDEPTATTQPTSIKEAVQEVVLTIGNLSDLTGPSANAQYFINLALDDLEQNWKIYRKKYLKLTQ